MTLATQFKRCAGCEQWKAESDFEQLPSGSLRSKCRPCRAAYLAAWKAKEAERMAAAVEPEPAAEADDVPRRHRTSGRGLNVTAATLTRERKHQDAALVGAELARLYRALHAWWVTAGYGTAEGGAPGPSQNRAVAATHETSERLRELRRER